MAHVQTKPLLNIYGFTEKTDMFRNQLEIEMRSFALGLGEDKGFLGKAGHFKNILRLVYPWVWDNWHDWNELCLWAWTNYDEIGMTGCAAAHKTFTFSLLGLMEFMCSPFNTAVIATSVTLPSLRTRLWAQMMKFWNGGTVPLEDGSRMSFPWPYHLVDSKTTIQAKKGDSEHQVRAVAVQSGPVEQAIGNLIGAHPGRVIMMVDEAAQTREAVFSARSNLSTATTFFRFVAIANAVSQFDAHGKFCEPKRGWSTVSVNDEFWETKTGICLHFDGLKSPNVKLGKKRFPSLFAEDDIERIRTQKGENSLEWWSMVRGYWPPSGVRNTVLDAAMIITGKAREEAIWQEGFRIIAGLDPAFTTGGDRCVLRFARIGRFNDGIFGMELFDKIEIFLDAASKIPINYQIAYRVKKECEERKVPPQDFGGDATAASGLFDIISQVWSPLIRRIGFGGKATERPIGDGDTRHADKVYKNRVTELWFSVERLVRFKRLRGLDDETAQEFCTRLYELEGEKIVLESKSDMKERTAGTSPDLADPVGILADIFRDIHGIDQATLTSTDPMTTDWMALQKRYNRLHTKSYAA